MNKFYQKWGPNGLPITPLLVEVTGQLPFGENYQAQNSNPVLTQSPCFSRAYKGWHASSTDASFIRSVLFKKNLKEKDSILWMSHYT